MRQTITRLLLLLPIPALAFAAATVPSKSADERNTKNVDEPGALPDNQPVFPKRAPARRASFVYQPGVGLDLLIQADRQTIRQLRLAKELIGRKDYVNAVELLQRVLNRNKDAFYYPNPEKRDVLSSIRGAAERMIAGMPKAGKDAYHLKYGVAAKVALDDAVKAGRLDKLSEIVRRFFHTPAGYEATYRSGIVHQDQQQHLAAALCFERLRELPDVAGQWEPMLSLRSALCLSRAGLADQAKKALAGFHQQIGGRAISLGGKSVRGFTELKDGPKWLAQHFTGAAPRDVRETEWVLFRGNRRRNGIVPLPEKSDRVTWRMSTVVDPEEVTADVHEKVPTANIRKLRIALKGAAALNDQLRVPLPPAVHPVVINDVVYVRTLDFVRAIEVKTGQRLWESIPSIVLPHHLEPDEAQIGSRSSAATALVRQQAFYDLNRGIFASDGRHVYAVEESGFASVRYNRTNRKTTTPKVGNRLVALDLTNTGKIAWSIGGLSDDYGPDAMTETFFLGAPLPIGRRLYCMAEVKNEIRLLVLEQRFGGPGRNRDVNVEVVWSQPLVGAGQSITRDWTRRTSAATVSYADGILVCNTGAGYVIGVNLTSQSLMWAYRYGTQRRPPFPFPRPRPRPIPPPRTQAGWFDSAAAISTGRVVITPPGSNEIHCLNLFDGSVVWKKPQGDGLYVAGIVADRVIVVGSGTVRALNLKDGKAGWKTSAKIAVPSGRGIIAGNRLFVPTRTDGIVMLDVATGKQIAKAKLPGNRRPGNLVISGGTMISQGIDAVDAFPLPGIELAKKSKP